MILTIKATVAAAAIVGAIAASAGVTYVAVKSSMATTVNCPAPTAAAKPDFPTGPRLPIQGKSY
jgi:hypothetical protein